MAAGASVRTTMNPPFNTQSRALDNYKRLYPFVDEKRTPLPKAWNAKEKFNYVGLTQNNLRAHYKGQGKTHRDAASVQSNHPIPSTCGLYYFEVKIVSKGRDGYMGIGLSAQGVNMNRLPGWDKHSYGYHGDDGHSFCSSGTGQPYGPTFTTGDVIGCGINLVDNSCFYTKNGHNLGTAFTDLPPNLYPTVGLQTPGEVIDANFGQEPFVFDIEDVFNELKAKTSLLICNYPVPESQGQWQNILHSIVSSYLIHHGYCNTAEALAHITNQPFNEDIVCLKNRKRIIKLVLAGRMSEAIEKTYKTYPGLLECNQNLLFMLKCRQFVEMVNGSDIQACTAPCRKSVGTYSPFNSSSRANSPIQTSVIQSTKSYSNKSKPSIDELNNQNNTAINGSSETSVIRTTDDSDIEMDNVDEVQNGHACNGKITTNGYQNGNSHNMCSDDEFQDDDEEMDIDNGIRKASKPAVERILEFGRELNNMHQVLKKAVGTNEANDQMLQDAFSLLAYSNPWASPVGWQLDHSQRERVSASLNSAILYSQSKPRKPPLEIAMGHAQEVLRLMATSGIGSCAFVSVKDIMEH